MYKEATSEQRDSCNNAIEQIELYLLSGDTASLQGAINMLKDAYNEVTETIDTTCRTVLDWS